MTAAADWLYDPARERVILHVIGLGFAVGIVLACAGFWALGKVGM